MNFSSFATQSLQLEYPDTSEADGTGHNDTRPQIVMVLDAKGCVQYCNDPAFFSLSDEELWGMPVASLVSSLPLRERTPGYNIAYVRFAFGHPQPRWLRKTAKVAEGKLANVDVFVRALPVGRGYCLLMALRPVEESSNVAIVMRKQPVPPRRPSLHLFAGSRGVMMADMSEGGRNINNKEEAMAQP